ncbi:MAG: urea transporter [Leptospiraceae bacterium]|nr:urea transporter [Leptospiraceae bacterium]
MTPFISTETALIILGAFSLLWIVFGWYLGRQNKDLDDYMLAGRKVGLAMATATAMATWVTSNTTMVAPQFALQMGVWGMVGYSFGSVGLLLFAPMARRIRTLMPHAWTSGDFMRLRYGSLAWRIFLGISGLYALAWLVSLGMAGGLLIEALSGLSYPIGMSTILAICVLYTLLGGLKAVIGTDLIQTFVILIGIVLLGYFTLTHASIEIMHEALLQKRPELLNLLFPAAIMFLFNNLLFGMGEIFHSNVWWSRAFAFGEGIGFKAYLTAGLLWIPVPIAAGFVALAIPALNIYIPRPDMAGPLVAANIMGTGGSIMVFIVVFSALASSLDSLLAATSDLVTEDIYHKHMRPDASPATLRSAAAWITVLIGIVTWLLCLLKMKTLGEVLLLSGSLVASTIWPIAAGLYWQRTNSTGVSIAMIAGSLAGLYSYFATGWYTAALTGAFVSMLIVLISSWLWPADFEWQRLKEDN